MFDLLVIILGILVLLTAIFGVLVQIYLLRKLKDDKKENKK